jgi:hypothetical protein
VGTWREDFRMAYLSSLITNLAISIHGKKGSKPTNPMDFMPKLDVVENEKGVKKQSVEDMKQALLAIANAHNKNLKGKSKLPSQLNKKTNG